MLFKHFLDLVLLVCVAFFCGGAVMYIVLLLLAESDKDCLPCCFGEGHTPQDDAECCCDDCAVQYECSKSADGYKSKWHHCGVETSDKDSRGRMTCQDVDNGGGWL